MRADQLCHARIEATAQPIGAHLFVTIIVDRRFIAVVFRDEQVSDVMSQCCGDQPGGCALALGERCASQRVVNLPDGVGVPGKTAIKKQASKFIDRTNIHDSLSAAHRWS
jgi:hypothetical protein